MSSSSFESIRTRTPIRSSPPVFGTPVLRSPVPRRSVFRSPLFRRIADEIDRDHSVDPIVGGSSASEWRKRQEEAREWKTQVGRQIELEIDEAIKIKDQNKTLRLQREIALLHSLGKNEFYQQLNRLTS